MLGGMVGRLGRCWRVAVEHVAEVHGLLMDSGGGVYDVLEGGMLICGNYVRDVCVYMPGSDAVLWGKVSADRRLGVPVRQASVRRGMRVVEAIWIGRGGIWMAGEE